MSEHGQAAMSEANRRLAGILAADVVGYSAMVGTDEPATLARVRTLRTDLVEPVAATLWRPTVQDHRRWLPHRLRQRRAGITLRYRHPGAVALRA